MPPLCIVPDLNTRPRLKQWGATMVEWTLGATVLFLGVAMAIEFAHWQTTRHIASIALMEAARAGSVQHAHPDAIRQAFLTSMQARFAHHSNSADAMTRSFERVRASTQLTAWQIEQRSPDDAAFSRAPVDDGRRVRHARGKRVLKHDLTERDGQPRHLAASGRVGWATDPNGPHARALTLHLRLTYRQPALFPALARLASSLTSTDASTRRAWAAGLLVIRLDQKIEMQSDAVQWGSGPIE